MVREIGIICAGSGRVNWHNPPLQARGVVGCRSWRSRPSLRPQKKAAHMGPLPKEAVSGRDV